ncbi:extracellular solute-binding protein [Paenibacillus sp. J5C_2022]|uniref:extracellular solute-binding protein n=1 Tax=Paenibacillus sp. J5C2022 TaxID=2977129 RepID=UPI0021D00568|nr:extracellular solute-binding protein [Paenibacillus sp. J5C2022]MCU6712165.1 extracellular solute-binding protein [Paenibacillus sp. J5C2022]
MPQSSKPSRKSFQQRLNHMIQSLRSDILNGQYRAGDYLPGEKLLADQFILSNKSVRKGLDQLVSEGLIQKIDRVGSQVLQADTIETVALGYNSTIERDIALSALVEDFQALHPHVRVKCLPLKSTKDYIESISTYMEHEMIDLFTMNHRDFQSLIEDGELAALQPQPESEHVYPLSKEAFSIHGMLYARPLVFSPLILVYNRTHFAECGIPEPDGSWTWHDALRHAAALASPGQRHGMYFHLLSDNRWPIFPLQGGVDFLADEEWYERVDNEVIASCRMCKTLISNHHVFPNLLSESSDDVNELFREGKVSMILTTYMSLNDFRDSELDYDISPLPFLFEPKSVTVVIGVAMNKRSSGKPSARLLMDYLSSARAQQLIRQRTLSLPATKKVAEAPPPIAVQHAPQGTRLPELNIPSRFALFRETMSSFRLHSALHLSDQPFNRLKTILKHYWADLMDESGLYLELRTLFREEARKRRRQAHE